MVTTMALGCSPLAAPTVLDTTQLADAGEVDVNGQGSDAEIVLADGTSSSDTDLGLTGGGNLLGLGWHGTNPMNLIGPESLPDGVHLLAYQNPWYVLNADSLQIAEAVPPPCSKRPPAHYPPRPKCESEATMLLAVAPAGNGVARVLLQVENWFGPSDKPGKNKGKSQISLWLTHEGNTSSMIMLPQNFDMLRFRDFWGLGLLTTSPDEHVIAIHGSKKGPIKAFRWKPGTSSVVQATSTIDAISARGESASYYLVGKRLGNLVPVALAYEEEVPSDFGGWPHYELASWSMGHYNMMTNHVTFQPAGFVVPDKTMAAVAMVPGKPTSVQLLFAGRRWSAMGILPTPAGSRGLTLIEAGATQQPMQLAWILLPDPAPPKPLEPLTLPQVIGHSSSPSGHLVFMGPAIVDPLTRTVQGNGTEFFVVDIGWSGEVRRRFSVPGILGPYFSQHKVNAFTPHNSRLVFVPGPLVLVTDLWGHDSIASAGLCSQLAVADCQDDDPCTLSTCSPTKGCQHFPEVGLPCNSGKGICKALPGWIQGSETAPITCQ